MLASVACGERAAPVETVPARSGSSGTPGESTAPQSEPVRRSLCPDCPEQAGGESSDFGSRSACVRAERRSSVDRARAAELGFDVDTVERLVVRSFQAPLRWTRSDMDLPTPARGYEVETWIEGEVTLDSYQYVGLDPALCDGETCTIESDELRCSDRLELDLSSHLRTLDGAVEMDAKGYGLVGRDGFPFSEYPAGIVRANLRDATGSLELFPNPELPIASAEMLADFHFKVDQIEGDLRPSILQHVIVGVAQRAYFPLSGHWPDSP